MAVYQVILTDDALQDTLETFDWYEEQLPGLGDDFYERLLAVFDQLSHQPNSGRQIEHGIRKTLVFTFPYAVYYTVKEDTVRILRVMYQGRHPKAWKKRRNPRGK